VRERREGLTWIGTAFNKVSTVLLVGCLYLAGNFLAGQLQHELLDPLIKSSDPVGKEAAQITRDVLLAKLILYQLSYFVLSFALAFSFRGLGAIVVGVIVFYHYLVAPVVIDSMPISAVSLWSPFISYQMATVSGAMLGLHMRKLEEKVVGSRS
jgi:hypothetical protein